MSYVRSYHRRWVISYRCTDLNTMQLQGSAKTAESMVARSGSYRRIDAGINPEEARPWGKYHAQVMNRPVPRLPHLPHATLAFRTFATLWSRQPGYIREVGMFRRGEGLHSPMGGCRGRGMFTRASDGSTEEEVGADMGRGQGTPSTSRRTLS